MIHLMENIYKLLDQKINWQYSSSGLLQTFIIDPHLKKIINIHIDKWNKLTFYIERKEIDFIFITSQIWRDKLNIMREKLKKN